MKKVFLEIRDRGTIIPVMAFRFGEETEPANRLIARSGFGNAKNAATYTFITVLSKQNGHYPTSCDPFFGKIER